MRNCKTCHTHTHTTCDRKNTRIVIKPSFILLSEKIEAKKKKRIDWKQNNENNNNIFIHLFKKKFFFVHFDDNNDRKISKATISTCELASKQKIT